MMRFVKNRAYGLVMVAIMVVTALTMAYDTQASIQHPGWFAELRTGVWCKTVLYGPQFNTTTFYHYPGKDLPRVMKELGVPPQIRSIYLKAEKQETLCFDTWKAAAEDNAKFQAVTKDYAEVLASWTEEDYQRVVIMLNLRRDGMALLGEIMKVKQRSLDQSRQQ